MSGDRGEHIANGERAPGLTRWNSSVEHDCPAGAANHRAAAASKPLSGPTSTPLPSATRPPLPAAAGDHCQHHARRQVRDRAR